MPFCTENNVDPDQLASSEASWSGSTLFSIDIISGFILLLKRLYMVYSKVRAKLSSLCIICSLEQVKFSLDKFIMTICLSLGKYEILLFP